MDKKKFAFVGVESYEVVLYLAKIYKNLGFHLTVFDFSPMHDLVACVPGVDVTHGSIDYADLTLVWSEVTNVETSEFSIYYFGFDLKNPLIHQCDEVWAFTDYQLHHLHALKSLKLSGEQARFAVFYTDDLVRLNPRLVLEELRPLNIREENFIEIPSTTKEFKCHCQYDSVINWKRGSKALKGLATSFLDVDFSKKEIAAAIGGGKK